VIEQDQTAMRRAVVLSERPTHARNTNVVAFASRLATPVVPPPTAPLEDAVRHVRVRARGHQTVLVRPLLAGQTAEYIGRGVSVVRL
jgi:hypothetical protein